MHKLYSNKMMILAFILPALILFVLFVPIPVAFLLGTSFLKWDLLSEIRFNGLGNYIYLFTKDTYFWGAVKNNLFWMVGNIAFSIIPAFVLAIILNSKIKGRNFFRTVVFLPVALSSTAVAMIWYFVYHHKIGILNQIIRFLGFANFEYAWLMDERIALLCVLIAVGWQWTGYYMVIFLSGLTVIPGEVIESAEIDGANRWQLLKSITIPYLKPMFKITAILAIVSSFKGFDNVYVLTGGGPNRATYLMALHMYDMTFNRAMYGYGSSIAVIITILCVLTTLGISKLFARDSMEV
ncbi:MAG: sugar ABC transporter permease [Firmicutes bacterium]|nr:sugar ABC transporter permease [Bacillota bacterium]